MIELEINTVRATVAAVIEPENRRRKEEKEQAYNSSRSNDSKEEHDRTWNLSIGKKWQRKEADELDWYPISIMITLHHHHHHCFYCYRWYRHW